MDVGATQIVGVIASSTSSYFEVFSPIFLLMGGIVFAFLIIEYLINTVSGNKKEFLQDYAQDPDA